MLREICHVAALVIGFLPLIFYDVSREYAGFFVLLFVGWALFVNWLMKKWTPPPQTPRASPKPQDPDKITDDSSRFA